MEMHGQQQNKIGGNFPRIITKHSSIQECTFVVIGHRLIHHKYKTAGHTCSGPRRDKDTPQFMQQ
jgi:hypothetical protein